jgi:hypothetical protein
MIENNARGVTRLDHIGVAIAFAAAKWLRFAAAPTFTIMALLTVVLDNNLPNTFCTAAGSLWPGGMAPMYLLIGCLSSGAMAEADLPATKCCRHAQCTPVGLFS